MSDRGMTTAVLDEIAKSQNEPFHLIEIYFDTGTVYITDHYSAVTWNSNTYLAGGQFLTFSNINESNALTVSDIEIQLSGVDRTFLVQILTENFMDREVIIRKGFMNTSNSVIADPIIIYSGKMDEPVINEGSDNCTIGVKVANLFVDFMKTNGRYTNQESQQLFFPADLGFSYAHSVIKDIQWGVEGTYGSGMPSIITVIGGGEGIVFPTIPIGAIPYWNSEIYGGGLFVEDGLSIMTVRALNHYLTTGDNVEITNALAVGEVPAKAINKYHSATVIDGDTFTIPITETITKSVSNGGGDEYKIDEKRMEVPFIETKTTTNYENIITITDPFTEVLAGQMVTFQNVVDVGGIPAANFNDVSHYVNAVNDNSFDLVIQKTENITSPPIKTTALSTTVDIEIANNTYNIGDSIVLTGAIDTGGVTAANINGTQTITAVKENSISFVASTTASSTTRGGGTGVYIDNEQPYSAPVEITNGSNTATLHESDHGMAAGDKFTLLNMMPFANIPPSELNKEHTVASVPDANTATFAVTTNANATTTGGGSKAKVMLPVKATSAARGSGSGSKVGRRMGMS